MDALALLCTLHADGPTTLRRLRDAGCTSLDDLGRVRAERIAELLEVAPAAARRFLREARNLSERLGGRALEPEEHMDPAAAAAPTSNVPRPLETRAAEATAKGSTATPADAPGAAAVPGGRASLGSRELDRADQRVLAKVIERWRAEEARGEESSVPPPPLAASAPRAASDSGAAADNPAPPVGASRAAERAETVSPSAAVADVERPVAALPAREAERTERAEPKGDAAPTECAAPRGTPLTEDLVDGLDADACARLAAAGCATLEDLARRDALALAEAADLPFTRLRRLQFLARRRASASRERLSPSPYAAVSSDAFHGATERRGGATDSDAEGAAGPFA